MQFRATFTKHQSKNTDLVYFETIVERGDQSYMFNTYCSRTLCDHEGDEPKPRPDVAIPELSLPRIFDVIENMFENDVISRFVR